MIEYVIFIVMVVFVTGFAWLWLIEQRKRRVKKEARSKKAIERKRCKPHPRDAN